MIRNANIIRPQNGAWWRDVDAQQPLNYNHPILSHSASVYIPLSPINGTLLPDMCGKYNATISGGAQYGMSNGHPCITLDSSASQFINFSPFVANSLITGAGLNTYILGFKWISSGADVLILDFGTNTNRRFRIGVTDSTGMLTIGTSNSGGGSGALVNVTPIVSGEDVFLSYSHSSSAVRIKVNNFTTTSGAGGPGSVSGDFKYIGRSSANVYANLSFYFMISTRLFTNDWSAIDAIRNEWQMGWPTLLRRTHSPLSRPLSPTAAPSLLQQQINILS